MEIETGKRNSNPDVIQDALAKRREQERPCNKDCPLFKTDRTMNWTACGLYNTPVLPGHVCSFDNAFSGKEEAIVDWLMRTKRKQ